MPCYSPRNAYRRESGVVSFREPEPTSTEGFEVVGIPCGYCVGCRVRKARDWAVRCLIEDSAHEEACFVTLTYDDSHLPASGLLVKAHLSGWLKRVRSRLRADDVSDRKAFWRGGYVGPWPFRKLRFFACGEYGEQTRRPHYHAILWGLRDSPHLQEAWADSRGDVLGHVRVDPCSPAAISYVAGYVGKKIGDPSFRPSTRVHQLYDSETGEDLGQVYERVKDPHAPFLLMSRRPGIGGHARANPRAWGESAVFRGNLVPVPRFLHESYKSFVDSAEYEALHAKKRADMTERIVRESRFQKDVLAAGRRVAESFITLKSENRSL